MYETQRGVNPAKCEDEKRRCIASAKLGSIEGLDDKWALRPTPNLLFHLDVRVPRDGDGVCKEGGNNVVQNACAAPNHQSPSRLTTRPRILQ